MSTIHHDPNTPERNRSPIPDWRKDVTSAFARFDWRVLIPPIEAKLALLPADLGEIHESMRSQLKLLARGGWYPHDDMNMGLFLEAVTDISKGNFEGANSRMEQFFQRRYKSIKSRILSELPNRSIVLASAFQAHEKGEYILSVPLFLIQADGICYDVAEVQLYGRAKKKPKLAEIIERVDEDRMMKVMLSPLAISMPLTANPNERREPDYPPGSLNRHQVVHGESVDYGTKINSFKTIALLSYICDMRKALAVGKAA